jgi:hypothetical protein
VSHPPFLDEEPFERERAAELLGIKAAELDRLLDSADPLILYRVGARPRTHVTWAEFVTLALYKRSGVSAMEFDAFVIHGTAHVAPSRSAVKAALDNPQRPPEGLQKLRSWLQWFDADEDGWAVVYHPNGRVHPPRINSDGSIDESDEE